MEPISGLIDPHQIMYDPTTTCVEWSLGVAVGPGYERSTNSVREIPTSSEVGS